MLYLYEIPLQAGRVLQKKSSLLVKILRFWPFLINHAWQFWPLWPSVQGCVIHHVKTTLVTTSKFI